MEEFILTIRCDDAPGIVLAIAQGVAEAGGNILESDQYSDVITGLFCIRMRFEEYSVGILFTLISAFLRRLHLPEHQAGELTILFVIHPILTRLTSLVLFALAHRRFDDYIFSILLPLRNCTLTRL